jgi:hypothetical protein
MVEYIKTKNGYFYKILKNGTKKRIAKKVFIIRGGGDKKI